MLKCSLFFLVMGVNFTNWKNMWRVGGHANNIELWNFPIWLSLERNRRNYPTKSRSLVNNTVTIRIVKIYLYHLLIGIFVNCFCCCRHCIHNYCEHVQYNLSFHYSVSLSGRTDNVTSCHLRSLTYLSVKCFVSGDMFLQCSILRTNPSSHLSPVDEYLLIHIQYKYI